MTESSPPPNIPKPDPHSLLLYFLENGAVLKRHWLLFAVAVGVACSFGAYTVRWLDTRQIDIVTADNAQLRDKATSVQQNATSVPPSQWRRLSDEQRADLIQALKQWPSKPKSIAVFAMAESEARQYGAQLADVFRAADIEPHQKEVPLSSGADTGLMVGVIVPPGTVMPRDGSPFPMSPTQSAQEFCDILKTVGLKPHYVPWVRNDGEPGDFDIFIGPKPW